MRAGQLGLIRRARSVLTCLPFWAGQRKAGPRRGRERGVWRAKGESQIKSLADVSLSLKSRQGQGPGSGSRAGGWKLGPGQVPGSAVLQTVRASHSAQPASGPLWAAAALLSRKPRAGRLRAPTYGAGMEQPLAPHSGYPAGSRLSSAHPSAVVCTHGRSPPSRLPQFCDYCHVQSPLCSLVPACCP